MSDFEGQEPGGEQRLSSIKVVLNAKREPQVEIKVYEGAEEAELDRLRQLAVKTFHDVLVDVGIGSREVA